MAVIFEGQIGLVIRVELGINVEQAGTVRIRYKKPSGANDAWVATKEDAVNGTITYTTLTGDLDENGLWHFNGEWNPDTPVADIHFGKTACLEVLALFDCP